MPLPDFIPSDHIAALEENRQEAVKKIIRSFTGDRETNLAKHRWVNVFGSCLSPKITSKITGIPVERYYRWRNSDPDFCRAINEAILAAREEMLGSALHRAIGYLKPDPTTKSGFEEDADGVPIRYGGSDMLVRALLGLDEKKPKEEGGVVVFLDTDRMRGRSISGSSAGGVTGD